MNDRDNQTGRRVSAAAENARNYLYVTAHYLVEQGVSGEQQTAVIGEMARRMMLPDGWQHDLKSRLAKEEGTVLDLRKYDAAVRKMIYRDALLAQRTDDQPNGGRAVTEHGLAIDLALSDEEAKSVSEWVGSYADWLAATNELIGADTLDRHLDPAMLEQYLGVLVHVMHVDGEAVADEEELIRRLAAELRVPEDRVPGLAAGSLDWEEIVRFVEQLEGDFVRRSLLKDICAVIHADGVVHDRETETMEKIRDLLALDRSHGEKIFEWTGRYFGLVEKWGSICPPDAGNNS